MKINKKTIIIVAIIAVVATIVSVAYVFRPEKTSVCNDKAQAEVSATDLISSYETDEEKANASFLGKVISVTGTITSVKTDEKGRIVIELEGGSMGMVSCTMNPKVTDTALFETGKQLSIKGECVGYTIDVVLVKCCIND